MLLLADDGKGLARWGCCCCVGKTSCRQTTLQPKETQQPTRRSSQPLPLTENAAALFSQPLSAPHLSLMVGPSSAPEPSALPPIRKCKSRAEGSGPLHQGSGR